MTHDAHLNRSLLTDLLFTMIPVILLLLLCTAPSAAQDWPMANGNAARTSCSVANVPQPPLRPAAQALLSIDNAQVCSYADGVLYVATSGEPNTLVAMNATNGTVLWTFDVPGTKGSMSHVPAVTDELVLCSGQHAAELYALNRQDGSLAWSVPMASGYARHAVIDGNRAYIVTDSLYCIDHTNGTVLWNYAFEAPTTPAVDDNAIYIVGDRMIIAVDKLTGEELWSVPSEHRYYGQVIPSGDVLYVTDLGMVRAIAKSDGSEIWNSGSPNVRLLSSVVTGSLAFNGDRLCASVWRDTSNVAKLLVLDPSNGDLLWSQAFEGEGLNSPLIVGGTVYVTSNENKILWGFDLMNGGLRCRHEEAEFNGQPVPADGELYVPTRNGIFVFEEGTVGIETPSPPAAAMDIALSPNPARDAVSVTVTLRERAPLRLSVHDLLGREIAVLADAAYDAGRHVFRWDAGAGSIPPTPAGIYLVTAHAGDMLRTERLLLH